MDTTLINSRAFHPLINIQIAVNWLVRLGHFNKWGSNQSISRPKWLKCYKFMLSFPGSFNYLCLYQQSSVSFIFTCVQWIHLDFKWRLLSSIWKITFSSFSSTSLCTTPRRHATYYFKVQVAALFWFTASSQVGLLFSSYSLMSMLIISQIAAPVASCIKLLTLMPKPSASQYWDSIQN